MTFEEIPENTQRTIALKLMCLCAHLDCAIDLAYELDFHPFVKTFRHDKSSEKFKKEAGIALQNLLYAFKTPDMTNTDEIQLEVFAMIKKIKEINMLALKNSIEEIKEG